MDELRAGIDDVDAEIVRLLDRRAALARGIGELKQREGLAVYAPASERRVLDRVTSLGDGGFPRRGLEAVFREIISTSVSLETRLKVGAVILQGMDAAQAVLFVVGFVTSAVVGYVTIRFLLNYLTNHSLRAFAFYRFGVAAMVAVLLLLGVGSF